MIGQTISHYRILERLGEGGMGVVYLAEDLLLKRRVALKFLPADAVADPEARARLTHEAQAAASLLHPNICPVYEIAEGAGQTFIAMAHLAGKTLRERLAEGPVPLAEALAIARQIGEGLAAAHAKGIVHRDVKPGNVMLLADGRPVLMDFGLAHVAGGTKLTRTGTTLGTAAYMAPEQARSEVADARSDVWALGVVLYELVSGRLPFAGKTEIALLYAIVSAEPEPLAATVPGIPAGLNGIVTKALAKEATRRYASAVDMVADLAALERDVTAEPAGKGRRTRRQRAWLTATIILGAVALIVGATALNVGGLRERLFEGGPRIRSIAVLPLANLSGDASQEYFADGMTEALINDLGQVSALRVISRTSVMTYKGAKKPLKEIARELHVDAIVEGSVIRSGQRVKISAQLIRAGQERQVWADAFERELKDVLALQGEIASTIGNAVKAKLTADERARLVRTRPVDSQAYELYLRGREHLVRGEYEKGIEWYLRAIELDPTFAPAQAGLSLCYTNLIVFTVRRPDDLGPDAMRTATRSVELDPQSADAHTALGYAKLNLEWDWAGAEAEFKRALALNPSNFLVASYYGHLLTFSLRGREARDLYAKMSEIDPSQARVYTALAYFYSRRYADAIESILKGTEPHMTPVRMECYARLGMCSQALALADSLAARGAVDESVLFTYMTCGQPARVRALYRPKTERQLTHPSLGVRWALECMVMGDKDQAIAWLERAVEGRGPWCLQLRMQQLFDGLRGDPRFERLVRRVGIPAPPAS